MRRLFLMAYDPGALEGIVRHLTDGMPMPRSSGRKIPDSAWESPWGPKPSKVSGASRDGGTIHLAVTVQRLCRTVNIVLRTLSLGSLA